MEATKMEAKDLVILELQLDRRVTYEQIAAKVSLCDYWRRMKIAEVFKVELSTALIATTIKKYLKNRSKQA